jgi:hypothetical protein
LPHHDAGVFHSFGLCGRNVVAFALGLPHMSLDSWCQAMASSARSRITLANVIHDVDRKRTRPDVVHRVVERVLQLWDKETKGDTVARDAACAAAQMSATLDRESPDVFCTEPYFPITEPVSRIVDAETLIEFFVLKSAYGILVKPHSRTMPKPIRKLKASQLRPNAMITGKRPLAWVTKTAKVDKLVTRFTRIGREKQVATRVRDYLGLDYIGENVEIVELRYPDGALAGCRISAPTFVEGACRHVYRSAERPDDPWGRAVDLGTKPFRNGAPEAVHNPIPLTAEFTYRHLGTVNASASCPENVLDTKCPRQWQSTDVDTIRTYMAP